MPIDDPDDLPLDRAPSTPTRFAPPADDRNITPLIVAGALVVAALTGGAWWWTHRTAATPAAAANAAAPPPAPVAAPAPPPAEPLPAIDAMDPMLRSLIGALSSRPELARWLATDNLLRQIAAGIDNASQGQSPTRDFRMFAPTGPFAVSGRRAVRTIDPASYRRYVPLVRLIASIDASAVARIFRTIEPRLNEAYRARGHADGDVRRALNAALKTALDAPLVTEPVAVVEGAGARWRFADPGIESRPPLQKQIVRMGHENAEALLTWLRAVSNALTN